MSDVTQTPSSNEKDSMQVVQDLVDVLKEDIQLRSVQLNHLNELIDSHNTLIKADMLAHSDKLRAEMAVGRDMEMARTNRVKWFSWLAGLVSVIGGLILAFLVIRMAYDMNRMEDYMYNMGHSANDDRRIFANERKNQSESYIGSMAANMQGMRDDMGAMRGAMARMDQSMGGMSRDIAQMGLDMTAMRTDIGTMNGTMHLLHLDTASLNHGVGSMSNDTRSMGAPFRMMDGFMPW